MKKLILFVFLIQWAFIAMAQYQANTPPKGYYLNPIFAGDYPDPSILRDNNDFYMVAVKLLPMGYH